MRYFDEDDATELNAEPWQLDLLKCNPAYCSWGPHEDYMWNEGEGWGGRVIVSTWADFSGWSLDDLNECVNFYFSVERKSKECPTCEGNGYHPDAQKVVRTFYQHSCHAGETPWGDDITEDEKAALVEAGRDSGIFGHDAINRHILIEARLKRLGINQTCPECEGSGYVYTAPRAHASLTLWWLHPRKGCSRGIEVTTIKKADLPSIKNFLAEAAKRNAERFAGIESLPETHQEQENRLENAKNGQAESTR